MELGDEGRVERRREGRVERGGKGRNDNDREKWGGVAIRPEL